MKRELLSFCLISCFFVFLSCNNAPTDEHKFDTGNKHIDTVAINPVVDSNTLVSFAIDSILIPVKQGNLIKCADHLSSDLGILLAPYGNIDTLRNIHLSPIQFTTLAKSKNKMRWGFADGTGEPIELTLRDYFKKFVYDVDFIKAEKISVNNVIDPDPGVRNIETIYPNASYVQFYFPGFKKEYDGMDWRSLTLVFKTKHNKLYLVAIVHDQWKI